MNRRVLSALFAWWIATAAFGAVAASAATFPASLILYVDYHPDRGDRPFDFSLSGFAIRDAKYIAPDGTEFEDRQYVSGLSISDLTSRFLGEWTINVGSLDFPVMPERYTVLINSLELDNFAAVPAILSPPDGARLPAEFPIRQTGDIHVMESMNFRRSSSDPNVDLSSHAKSFPISVTAWSATSVNLPLGNATTEESYTYVIRATKRTFSPPVTWTVGVPEPSTLGLASLALLSLASLRRRE